jgi:heme exporter protein C
MTIGINWFKYSSPASFYPLAGRLAPWFFAAAALLAICGLYVSFFVAPTDAQQGEAYRIIFIHVAAAWMSMFIYVVMAFWAGVGLAFNTRLSSMAASALAPTGALMTFVALWTGALWGKPMWGTWWVWDARLTSQLIGFFLYLGYMALHSAFDDLQRADRASGLLAVVGVVNVPIIHFSVYWWNTLHQGSTVIRAGGPAMPAAMLIPLLMSFAGFTFFYAAVVCVRLRGEVLTRERNASWLKELGSAQ